MPNNLWHYSEGYLHRKFNKTRDYIGYNFKDERWKRGGDSYSGTIDFKQSKPASPQLPKEKLTTNIINEFNRRIQREPNELEHYERLASYLILIDQKNDAIELCRDAIKLMPNEWWPRLADAILSYEINEDKTPTEAFAQWVISNPPEFINYYYLCYLYRIQNEDGKAIQILKSAMQNCSEEERLDGEYSCALYAYHQKEYQLAIDICNRIANHPWDQKYYLPIRSACYLSIGERQKAKEDISKALNEVDGKTSLGINWWGRNLGPLHEAVKKNDINFVYDPGPDGVTEFEIFTKKSEEILYYVP